MLDKLRTARGVMRSLGVYYGRKSRTAEKDRLYAQFVKRGDLVFDVGRSCRRPRGIVPKTGRARGRDRAAARARIDAEGVSTAATAT